MGSAAEQIAAGLKHHQAGRLQDAADIYRQILAADPLHAAAMHLLGVVALQTGRPQAALEFIRRAVELNPAEAVFHNNLGNAYQGLGQAAAAIACYRRAIDLQPRYVDAHVNLGIALRGAGRLVEAIAQLRAALELNSNLAEAHGNLGKCLQDQQQLDEAARCYRRARELMPDYVDAVRSLGEVCKLLGQADESLACYRRLVELRPQDPEALFNLARASQICGQLEPAVAAYRRVLELRPDHPEAIHNLGHAFKVLGRMDEAAASYRQTVELQPKNLSALTALVHALQQACDWDGLLELAQRVIALVEDGSPAATLAPASPFFFLTLPIETTARQQLRCAEQWVARLPRIPLAAVPSGRPGRERGPQSRLTIGYLSSDFHAHATAFLVAELFEKHDRDRFAIYGYSYGPDDRSPMRQRLVDGLDRFVDITAESPAASAERIAADGVDILVDLKGYTQGARTPILALRPAPIQVNYLGYPGTMGAPFVDYILVDDFIVPEDQQPFFSEKLVYLPGCYQVNDSRRAIAPRTPSRAECGLPDESFVFCSFNNNYKITPAVFGVWMELLKAVPGSVLWLWESNRYAPVNLRKHAQAAGVAAERLVFAPRRPLDEHLARLRLADLFLDTFPVNAHTTASDALWAGCPLVTMAGSTLVSRVASSLLRTIGLGELVTNNLDEYAALALRLARDPARLAELRARVVVGRTASPLFDGGRFARNLERAYEQMWAIQAAGEVPQAFRV